MRASERTTSGAFSKPPRLSTPCALTLSRKQDIYFQLYIRESSLISVRTHLVRVSERADLRCIAFDHRRLPLVQQFCDPHSRQRKDSLLHSTFDIKTLTGSCGPTERRGADTDRIEHHRLAVLIRVAARGKNPIERVHGPEIDEQAAGHARKVGLFCFIRPTRA